MRYQIGFFPVRIPEPAPRHQDDRQDPPPAYEAVPVEGQVCLVCLANPALRLPDGRCSHIASGEVMVDIQIPDQLWEPPLDELEEDSQEGPASSSTPRVVSGSFRSVSSRLDAGVVVDEVDRAH